MTDQQPPMHHPDELVATSSTQDRDTGPIQATPEAPQAEAPKPEQAEQPEHAEQPELPSFDPTSFAPKGMTRAALPAGRAHWKAAVSVVVGAVVWIIKVATRLAALTLALHAVFVILKANQSNTWYSVVESLSVNWLSLGTDALFDMADPRWEIVANHGLAAILWLVVGAVAARLVSRIVIR